MNTMSLKKRIHSGETLIGKAVPLNSDRESLKSTLERGPYDFISVDSQHAAYNEDTLVSFCETAAELGVHVQFRIKHTRHAYLAGNYLDLGPAGIEVPQVESEATVDEAVSYFYYPQVGIRSWGGRARLGLRERTDRRDYAKWWSETGVLWMQIESVEAVTNARKLAKPGVDCLAFGPEDLNFSIEGHPNHPFKTYDDCIAYVVEQLQGTNVVACVRTSTPEDRKKYFDMGVTVLLERPGP